MSHSPPPPPPATLRLARAEDAAAIAAIYAPSVATTAISFEIDPPRAEEMRDRMATVQAYAPWLVCEVTGKVGGFAYVSRHRERAAYQWCLDSAVYVAAEHQRKGIGRALYTTLFALARLQGYYAVHAGVTLPNSGSVALHEGFGFRPVGVYAGVGYKLGAWRDVGWWQLELRERRAEPALPRSVQQVEADQSREWGAAFRSGQRLLKASAV